MQHNQGII